MKRIFFITLSFCTLLFGQFSVDRFCTGMAYPQAGTSLFAPRSGSYLTEITEISSNPTLRRRFSCTEYRLYDGMFTPALYSSRTNIQRFLRPKFLTREQFLKMKYFDSQRINSVGDIQDCYFHGDTAFIIGYNRLFFNYQGNWKSIDAVGQSLQRSTGDIAIRSNPSGAMIILNGETTGVVTPNYITELPEGECRVRVVHSDCVPRETTITVLPSKIHQINFDLNSRFGSVQFKGAPIGAKVKLNGLVVGTIPCRIDSLVPQEYMFSVEDPFYKKRTVAVTVGSGKVASATVELAKAYGVISLPDMPADRWWYINGEPVASGKLRFNEGTHRVFWDGGGRYKSVDTVIQLKTGDTVTVFAEMEKRYGGIKVLPLPMACSLFVDGEYRGEAPIVVDGLPVGNHSVELVRKGYGRVVKTVMVEGETVAEVRCELQKQGTSVASAEHSSASSAELSFISTKGQARVYQGELLVAVTGKGSVKIPAGKYEFRFETADSTTTKTVTVLSGERKAVLVSFAN